ncbi:MAG: MotA/TolQ/ExbB proton channel family protein [bacterium]
MRTLAQLLRRDVPEEPDLAFTRVDPEKRIGFPAGKYTAAGPLLAPLLAGAIAVGFYGVLSFLPENGIQAMFTQRGAVPYAIVALTALSFMILLIKRLKLRAQRRALDLKVLPGEDPGFVLTPASAEDVLSTLHRRVDDPSRFLLTHRIQTALANLRNMGRIGDVDEVLSSQAEHDEGVVDSSYTLVRGLIWAIPVLGFIGTVWGLSIALGAFGGVLAEAQDIGQLRTALQGVTGGLSTAFDTTLEGLVAALCVHLLMIVVRRREEQFLDDCKEYCQRYIVGRLRLTETEQ